MQVLGMTNLRIRPTAGKSVENQLEVAEKSGFGRRGRDQ
jgi:hypothetical protein